MAVATEEKFPGLEEGEPNSKNIIIVQLYEELHL
jgi:hypothetical protein